MVDVSAESLEFKIIQGGMGAGVSNWRLANAVSRLGQLGVVSGTALDLILARRLQNGDENVVRALSHFPDQKIADGIIEKYFVPGGKAHDAPYKPTPASSHNLSKGFLDLCVVANFVEVFLAKEGHNNPVGINYLEKIQLPHLPSIYGAMLAGVDYVIMGAGIPTQIPRVLDSFANSQPSFYNVVVEGGSLAVKFNPGTYFDSLSLKRPKFFPIIASNLLATILLRKAEGSIEGFVVERPTAGGHNAPPRVKGQFNEIGEPIYGPKDEVDLQKLAELKYPFYLAGSTATPECLENVLAVGGNGIQVGTAFAFCDESGVRTEYKLALIRKAIEGRVQVYTDARASPTGFPFKVALLEGTISEQKKYEERTRICDLRYLRDIYVDAKGRIGMRCPSEPVEDYLKKSGKIEDTIGRKCLCNGLLANIGLAQIKEDGSTELPLITSGDDLANIGRFLQPGKESYSAEDVIKYLLRS